MEKTRHGFVEILDKIMDLLKKSNLLKSTRDISGDKTSFIIATQHYISCWEMAV